jgi:adenosylcobinamide kinase/adenosylcobinamide-phosphate guanylyltransferase
VKKTILVIGGCRSGKSSHALHLAEQISGQKIFIATCVPQDKEMEQRVLNHRQQRSHVWETIEVPILIPEAIQQYGTKAHVILVDCLTIWINNLIIDDEDPKKMDSQIRKLTQSIDNSECPVILVSNEVGAGIVPENKLARLFRDIVGFANQKVAACVDQVIWMVAGIPVKIK